MTRIQHRRDSTANWTTVDPIPAVGELCYDTTTGSLVCGDGTSHHSELPDIRKQFQNVVTVAKTGKKGTADFICSDYTSDDECIQAAVDYCAAKNINNLWIGEGTYTINSQVHITSSLDMEGIGKVEFVSLCPEYIPMLFCEGSQIASTTLQADASSGLSTISLIDSAGIESGDLLRIWNTNLWTNSSANYPTLMQGELYEISNVNLDTHVITLSEYLLRGYLQSSTNVRVYHPIVVNISNITVVGQSSSISYEAIRFKYVSNSTIQKCNYFKNGFGAIVLLTCYNVTVENNVIRDATRYNESGGAAGYGVDISNACANIKILHNEITNCRHCITSGISEDYGVNRGITIDGNTLVAATVTTSYAIDAHPATIDYTITNNKIYLSSGVQYAFWDGTVKSTFSNNQIYGGGGVKTRGIILSSPRIQLLSNNILEANVTTGYYGSFYNGESGTNIIDSLVITNNIISGLPYGLSVSKDTYRSATISNNTIHNCSISGITLSPNAIDYPGAYTSNMTVSNNTIYNCAQGGIIATRTDPADIVNINIYSNTLSSVSTGANAAGILLMSIDGANVYKNRINDVYYGCRETCISEWDITTIDNNCINNNKISNTTIPIVKLGTYTKISGNDGYPTENTGTSTIAATTTYITVEHGLAATPTQVNIQPTTNLQGKSCWPSDYGSTTFTINISEADATNPINFNWSATV